MTSAAAPDRTADTTEAAPPAAYPLGAMPSSMPPSLRASATRGAEHYAAMSEQERQAAWAHAPLVAADNLYFETNGHDPDRDELAESVRGYVIGLGHPDDLVSVSTDDDTGTTYVLVPPGDGPGAQAFLKRWLADRGISHNGVRHTANKRRRDLRQLPEPFREHVVMMMTGLCFTRLNSRMRAQAVQLLPSSDDRLVFTYAEVMDILREFDPQVGVTVESFVLGKFKNRLIDFARARTSRSLNDFTTRLAAVERSLVQQGEPVTDSAVAAALGMDEVKFRQRRQQAADAAALRNAASLSGGADRSIDSDGGYDVDPVAPDDTEAELVDEEVQAAISTALVVGTLGRNAERLIVEEDYSYQAFLATYMQTYGGWSKAELARAAGVSPTTLTERMRLSLTRVEHALRDADVSDI